MLNLVGNACYAVNERSAEAPDGYEPTVWVITRGKETGLEIEVRDNGPGIDEAIREQVMTPFFTTKPPSVGAGLGLSQCADAARQHGGTIALGSSASGGAAVPDCSSREQRLRTLDARSRPSRWKGTR